MTFQIWFYWVTGVILGGAGAFLMSWGLFSDRLSGTWKKRRCRKCLYDMTNVSGLKCPECGREARREAELKTPRRRWGLATTGVVLSLGAFAFNWYAAGLLVGWPNVAPVAVLVRLAPFIGRENALRAVAPTGQFGMPTLTPVTTATNLTFAPTERLALSVLQDKNATNSEIFAAVDALHWMRDRITREDEIVKALQDCVKSRQIPLFTWSDLYYALIMKSESRQDPAVVLEAVQSSGISAHGFANKLVAGGLTSMGARIFPDLLVSAQVPGVTWNQFEYISPELKAAILKRCREVYFSGDDEVKVRISRFLWPNGQYMPADNPDFEAIAREQIERFGRGETTEALTMNSFILWQASEPLSGLMPEIAGMLSGPTEEGRKRALGILQSVKLTHPRPTELSAALCLVMRDGSDVGRSSAIDIVNRRRELDRDLVVGAALENLGRIQDPDVFDKMYRFVIQASDKSADSVPMAKRRALLEDQLQKNLSTDGPLAAISAGLIAKFDPPRPESIALLESVLHDPSKSKQARAAARDAILHLRDRTEADPTAPLDR